VVDVGATVVEPLADVDVNVPGVMATLVAPVMLKASVVLEPREMPARLAVNELIAGGGVTAMVIVAVTEPAELVAVSV
jgi:hypothetical protein